MIPVRCPHCHMGLKVDEKKLPAGIRLFKCPSCKEAIPISLLTEGDLCVFDSDFSDTVLIRQPNAGTGKIILLTDGDTNVHSFPLHEGMNVIGRKSAASQATIHIDTGDKSMSREHIRIEVKKDGEQGYKHYLSDNNSKNRTLCNSNYLGEGETIVLNDKDEIVIGHTVLQFSL
ncbi:hypothetical protein Barb6_01560 [Bacteroidales bacterium Barb6]|nr:hypothetical protein Barb6_01560 [Bacteroidales bacterium Barb6]